MVAIVWSISEECSFRWKAEKNFSTDRGQSITASPCLYESKIRTAGDKTPCGIMRRARTAQ